MKYRRWSAGISLFRRALLRACANGPADFKIQLCLRQISLQQGVQGCVHRGIVNWLSLVHFLILSDVSPQPESRKGKGGGAAALSLTAFCLQNLHNLFPQHDVLLVYCLI